MKAIKICPQNYTAIRKELEKINGGAVEHCYTDAAEMESLAKYAENRLEHFGIPKPMRKKARLHATSGSSVPNAYKYARIATSVILERRSSAWYLTQIGRTSIYKSGGGQRLHLTKDQDVCAVANLRGKYSVAAEEGGAA